MKFGRTCVRGTGVYAAWIYGRWLGGEEAYAIADDYGMHVTEVAAAIHFEIGRRERWSGEARELLEPDLEEVSRGKD